MKLLFTLLIAFCLAHTSVAQQKVPLKTSREKRPGWLAVSPGLSIGSGSYHYPDLPDDVDASRGTAVQAGCGVGYMFNPHIGLFSGLQFTSTAFSISLMDGFIHNKFTQTTGYIELPVYVRVISSQPGNIGLAAEAGFSAGLLLSSKLSLKATDVTTGASLTRSTKEKDGLNKGAASAFLFLGIRIPLTYSVELLPGIDYQYYLTRFSDEQDTKEHLSRLGVRLTANIQVNN